MCLGLFDICEQHRLNTVNFAVCSICNCAIFCWACVFDCVVSMQATCYAGASLVIWNTVWQSVTCRTIPWRPNWRPLRVEMIRTPSLDSVRWLRSQSTSQSAPTAGNLCWHTSTNPATLAVYGEIWKCAQCWAIQKRTEIPVSFGGPNRNILHFVTWRESCLRVSDWYDPSVGRRSSTE